MRKHQLLNGILLVGLGLFVVLSPLTAGAANPARPRVDFDADWYADLVIGVPYEDVNTSYDAGAVNVLHGGLGVGLSTAGNRMWTQDDDGVVGQAEIWDHFGSSLAAGDFNGDGCFDLAVGIPEESIGAVTDPGAVQIFYGTAAGLSAAGNQLWSQDTKGVEDAAEEGDDFGHALAAGDFDADGYDDLAVGVPDEDVGAPAVENAGVVHILYGSAAGLSSAGNQLWSQDSVGVEGKIEELDFFGAALATGDFDGDGYADLAIGVPQDWISRVLHVGAVNVLYGSGTGLTAAGNQIWHQDTTDVLDDAEYADSFGGDLAAGDFDNDGRDDLAVGVSGEDLDKPAVGDAGAVSLLYGSAGGLTAVGNQLWHQGRAGILDVAESDDFFGATLTAGDFNGDGHDDLAVGTPYENISMGIAGDAGAVNVLYGSGSGLSAAGNQFWHQDTAGVSDVSELGDRFGYALAAGDFDGNTYDDLVIGVPHEDLGTPNIGDMGMVHVLSGSAAGLVIRGADQVWSQDVADVAGLGGPGDLFGYALAVLPRQSPRQTRHTYMPLLLRR
jgi:hypothetical protein